MATTPETSGNGSPSSPPSSNGWFRSVMMVAREGGPATLALMLLLGGLSLWFMQGELQRQQGLTKELVQQLLAEKDKRIATLTQRLAECRAADGGKTRLQETNANGLPYGGPTQQ